MDGAITNMTTWTPKSARIVKKAGEEPKKEGISPVGAVGGVLGGVGGFMVGGPVGAGIGAAAGYGAGGAMHESIQDLLGRQTEKPIEQVKRVGTEAGIAGLLGLTAGGGVAVASKMGEVLDPNKLNVLGERLRQGVIKPKVKVEPLMEKKAQEIGAKARELGLKGPPTAQKEQVAGLYENLNKQLSGILSKQTKVTPQKTLQSLADKISKVIGEEVTNVTSTNRALVQKWSDKLMNSKSIKELSAIDKALRKEMASVYKAESVGRALNDKEIIKKAFHDNITKFIRTKVPETKNLFGKMQTLHQVIPGLDIQSKKAFPIPLVGKSEAIGQLGLSIQDLLGRALTRTPIR
jgi:hypothetical protein